MSDEFVIEGRVDRSLLTDLDALDRALKGAAAQESAFKAKAEALGESLTEQVRAQREHTRWVDQSRDAVRKAGDEMRRSAEEARKAASVWLQADTAVRRLGDGAKSFWESSSRFGEAWRNIRAPIADVTEAIDHAITRTAELATEQNRLDRAQQSLGLSLRRAQEGAGGFAEQTEIATAALTLQGQGIRATQAELDALVRLGMRRAQDTGRDLHDVLENLTEAVTEGGEEFGKVSPRLLAVADSSHSAGERLAALVVEAEKLGPASRTAADELGRMKEQVEGAQRAFATGFAEETTHLIQLTSNTRNAAEAAEEWNTSLRAVGSTAAYVLQLAVQGTGAVVGAVGYAGAAVSSLRLGIQNAVTGGPGLRETFEQNTAGMREFLDARVSALEALARDQETQRTEATPTAGPTMGQLARNRLLRSRTNQQLEGNEPAARPDMTFTRDETGLFNNNRRGGGRTRRAPEDTTDDAIRAQREANARAARFRAGEGEFANFLGFGAADERSRAAATARDTFQRERDADAFARSDEGMALTRGREREQQREQQAQEQRLEQMRSFTDRWRDLHTEQADITAQAMDSISGAIDAGGEAIGGAWEAIVTGQKDVADALQDGLKSFLLSVAKREAIEGGVEIAKGLSALAGIYTAPLAPGHFAAAAAHFGIAAAAGVGGAAIPASAPSSKGASGGSSASSGPRERPLTSNAQNAAAGGGGVTYNFTFGGGVIMGTPRDVAQGVVGLLNDPSNGAVINARRVQ